MMAHTTVFGLNLEQGGVMLSLIVICAEMLTLGQTMQVIIAQTARGVCATEPKLDQLHLISRQ
jgi:hypothetical protein